MRLQAPGTRLRVGDPRRKGSRQGPHAGVGRMKARTHEERSSE
jgi:hypothetical protein